MAKKGTSVNTKRAASRSESEPRCVAIAERGIADINTYIDFMSALMTDIVTQRVTSAVGSATSSVGGKLLKAAEMRIKYGKKNEKGEGQSLQLTS